MADELLNDHQFSELQSLQAVTSCKLLRATLEQQGRYLTSTRVKESGKEAEAVVSQVSKLSLGKEKDDSSDYEPLQYEWDQSSKFVKLYLTVVGLAAEDHDKVTCTFTDRGLHLTIINVNGKNYKLIEDNLVHRIKSKDSKYRLKEGSLVLFLWKATFDQRWSDVSKKACSTFLDHYGRSQLKTFLHEYGVIKSSKLFEAENNPLRSNIRRLLASQGYYDITDVVSAKNALTNFEKTPPTAVLISIGVPKTKSRHTSLLFDLVTGIAAHPCVAMVTCPGFIKPDQLKTDSETLDVLLSGRCELTHFAGRISPADVGRLPATLYKLGVGVAGPEDAAALTKMTLPENLQTLGVSVSRCVKIEDLSSLPMVKNPYQLFFDGVTDDDIAWVIGCLDKMVQRRVCWLNLPNSMLSASSIMLLRDKLFNDKWYLRKCQVDAFMLFSGHVPENPATLFQPSPPTAPILGIPPVPPSVPTGVVYGVLGVAVEVAACTEAERSWLLQGYKSYGCQLKWKGDWHWNDAV